MTEEKKWVPIRDTMLATEIDSRVASRLFGQAGFARMEEYVKDADTPSKFTTRACVEAKAEYITKKEILCMIAFKKAGAIVPDLPIKGGMTPRTQLITEDPSYAEILEVCEQQDTLIHELRDEVRQLRQHIAQLQHRNGLGDRARKALSAARQTLSLVKGE